MHTNGVKTLQRNRFKYVQKTKACNNALNKNWIPHNPNDIVHKHIILFTIGRFKQYILQVVIANVLPGDESRAFEQLELRNGRMHNVFLSTLYILSFAANCARRDAMHRWRMELSGTYNVRTGRSGLEGYITSMFMHTRFTFVFHQKIWGSNSVFQFKTFKDFISDKFEPNNHIWPPKENYLPALSNFFVPSCFEILFQHHQQIIAVVYRNSKGL